MKRTQLVYKKAQIVVKDFEEVITNDDEGIWFIGEI